MENNAKAIAEFDSDYFDQLVLFDGEDFKGNNVNGFVLHSKKRIDDEKHWREIKIGNTLQTEVIEHYKNILKKQYESIKK